MRPSDGLLDNVGGHRAHLPPEQLPLLPGKLLHWGKWAWGKWKRAEESWLDEGKDGTPAQPSVGGTVTKYGSRSESQRSTLWGRKGDAQE